MDQHEIALLQPGETVCLHPPDEQPPDPHGDCGHSRENHTSTAEGVPDTVPYVCMLLEEVSPSSHN